MKVIIALAIVAVAGCASRRAYEQAVIAHGRKFTAPIDSVSVMWARAQRGLARTNPVALLVSNRYIRSTPANAGAPGFTVVASVSIGAAGDTVVMFEVESTIWKGTRPYRDNRTRQYACELAYFMHYGITHANFSEPPK